MEHLASPNPNSTALQALDMPWVGPAALGGPDVPLYLSLERPLHYSDPDLCFVGRIGGLVVGAVGVFDVLYTLLRSLELHKPDNCPGHDTTCNVVNVKPSVWAANRHVKPACDDKITFISVEGDGTWALFLAGETTYFRGRIVFNCVDCVAKSGASARVYIGYLKS